MSLEENLKSMERSREAYWLRHPSTSSFKLRWRALTVRHSFHVLPGESILELGAGSGLWTEHLSTVFGVKVRSRPLFSMTSLRNRRQSSPTSNSQK